MASLARRLAPAAALGGLAVVIVGVADPALAGRSAAAADEAAVAPQSQATTTQEQSPTSPSQTDTQTDSQTDSQSDTQTDSQTDTQAGTDASGTCTGDQVTGAEVMTQWGPVQVTATVSDGAVCAVQAVEWPSNDHKSQMINSYAIPQLDAWASASPAQFDYVSGATYTSQAYQQSLQSILDSL